MAKSLINLFPLSLVLPPGKEAPKYYFSKIVFMKLSNIILMKSILCKNIELLFKHCLQLKTILQKSLMKLSICTAHLYRASELYISPLRLKGTD